MCRTDCNVKNEDECLKFSCITKYKYMNSINQSLADE
jgi:hypothetical protein